MRRIWVAVLAAAFLVGAVAPAMGQVGSVAPVTPSKSGMVSYIQGVVSVDDVLIPDPIVAQFPYMKEGGTLRTTEGRAEVVMNPGLMMRVGENSTLRMITNRFIDTRVELVQGAATVQLLEVDKDNSFTVVCKDAVVVIAKAGFYHFYAEPGGMKVFAGLARVQMGDQNIEVTAGKMLEFSGGKASVQKFDKEQTDALDRWSGRRGELVSIANASAARDCDNNLMNYRGSSYVNGNPCRGNWGWNPYYNMWTYITLANRYCDPFWGYCYYNPTGIWNYYYRPQPTIYTGGGGQPSGGGGGSPSYQTMAPTSSGSSGAVAASSAAMSAPSAGSGSTAAPAASSSEVGRGSASGAGHGR